MLCFMGVCHPKKILNKAVYTAALVADGWAGVENLEKELCDRPTDGRTDGKVGYRVACPRLKIEWRKVTTISELPLMLMYFC